MVLTVKGWWTAEERKTSTRSWKDYKEPGMRGKRVHWAQIVSLHSLIGLGERRQMISVLEAWQTSAKQQVLDHPLHHSTQMLVNP